MQTKGIVNSGECGIGDRGITEKAIQLGNRALDFIEKHPAIPVIAISLTVFGSMGRTAIRSGWTPEQVVGLGKSFPVQITIPTLSI